MSFNVICPQCGNEFRRVKERYAGKRLRCRCGNVFRAQNTPEPSRAKKPKRATKLHDFEVPELDSHDTPAGTDHDPGSSPLVPDFSLEGIEGIQPTPGSLDPSEFRSPVDHDRNGNDPVGEEPDLVAKRSGNGLARRAVLIAVCVATLLLLTWVAWTWMSR